MAVAFGALAMSTIDTRRDQMFPKLLPNEIGRLRRFGEIRRYAAGEQLFKTGEIGPGMFVIISGTVAVNRRDGLGRVVPLIEQGPGEFLAEVGQLSGQPALVDGVAKTAAGSTVTYLLLWIIVRSCAESREAVEALSRRPAGPKRLSANHGEDAHDRASNAKVTNH